MNEEEVKLGGQGFGYQWQQYKKAERCPVCGGNGLVPNGYYSHSHSNGPHGTWTSTSTMPETCRGCGGKGWITV